MTKLGTRERRVWEAAVLHQKMCRLLEIADEPSAILIHPNFRDTVNGTVEALKAFLHEHEKLIDELLGTIDLGLKKYQELQEEVQRLRRERSDRN